MVKKLSSVVKKLSSVVKKLRSVVKKLYTRHDTRRPQPLAKDPLLTAQCLKTGGLEGSSGELLEAAWGLKNLFWRALGDVLEAH